jgi:hypothetical protein
VACTTSAVRRFPPCRRSAALGPAAARHRGALKGVSRAGVWAQAARAGRCRALLHRCADGCYMPPDRSHAS